MYLSCAKQTWVSKKAKDKAAQLSSESVTKICVIKHGALGDMMLTRPMLITIRKEFPNAKITLAVIEHYMRGIPYDLIDNVHVMAGQGSNKTAVLASMKTLEAHDILFDITASSRSMWLSLFTRATLKIGYIHKGLHRLAYDIAIPRAHYRFESETFAEQLNVLGIDYDWPPIFDLPEIKPIIDQPYIVYFPTASDLEKSWPAEKFIELIRYSTDKYDNYLHIVLAGIADWEIDIAKDIVKKASHPNLKMLQGGEDTESIISNADLLVCNDTGIRNMAICYETPTIGVIPPNSAVAFGYQPFFGNHRIVHPTNNRVAEVESVIKLLDEFFADRKNIVQSS